MTYIEMRNWQSWRQKLQLSNREAGFFQTDASLATKKSQRAGVTVSIQGDPLPCGAGPVWGSFFFGRMLLDVSMARCEK